MERSHKCDAIFIFPSYTFPQKQVPFSNPEGIIERLAGKSRYTNKSGLLFDTRLKNVAAILLTNAGEADKLVTMSRKTRSWMSRSLAELQENHIQSILGTNKVVKIFKEEESYDTLTEVQQVRKMSRQNHWEKVAIIVTDQSTAKRVEGLIQTTGNFPQSEIRDISSILSDESYSKPTLRKYLKELVDKYNSSYFSKFWKLRETIAGKVEAYFPNVLSSFADLTRR